MLMALLSIISGVYLCHLNYFGKSKSQVRTVNALVIITIIGSDAKFGPLKISGKLIRRSCLNIVVWHVLVIFCF